VTDAYDELAEVYAADIDENPYNALYERPGIISLLPPVRGLRVLDAGCGSGQLAAWLAGQGADVTGIDAAPAMVRLAAARVPGGTFAVADLTAPLALADGAFDLVVSSLVLHYLRDWVAPLRELRRVLRPGGALVASTHHPAQDLRLSPSGDYHAVEAIEEVWVKGGRPFPVRYWRRPLSAMFDAFGEAGLRVERLAEPLPLPAARERFPEQWATLRTRPWFLFLHLRAS
jgi:SAM-dependent methyltransferase